MSRGIFLSPEDVYTFPFQMACLFYGNVSNLLHQAIVNDPSGAIPNNVNIESFSCFFLTQIFCTSHIP